MFRAVQVDYIKTSRDKFIITVVDDDFEDNVEIINSGWTLVNIMEGVITIYEKRNLNVRTNIALCLQKYAIEWGWINNSMDIKTVINELNRCVYSNCVPKYIVNWNDYNIENYFKLLMVWA